MNSEIIIRSATQKDIPQILDLVCELAVYEKQPEAVTAQLDDYNQAFKNGIFNAIVAESNQIIVGIALYYFCFSTWKGKSMYLEDFVVKKQWRRHGIGEKLFQEFLNDAKAKGCKMVRWQVLDWNEIALNFYEKYDATIDKAWWNGNIYF